MLRSSLVKLGQGLQFLWTSPAAVCKVFPVPIRTRWYETRKPALKRYGYEDKLAWRGPLPHLDIEKRLPMPAYCPKNSWSEKRALFGQNDYIDILGDGTIHPVQVQYHVPGWLKGFRGNEYQMLLRKRKFFGLGLRSANPEAHHNLQKRVRYLYKTLNRKRRYDYTAKPELK